MRMSKTQLHVSELRKLVFCFPFLNKIGNCFSSIYLNKLQAHAQLPFSRTAHKVHSVVHCLINGDYPIIYTPSQRQHNGAQASMLGREQRFVLQYTIVLPSLATHTVRTTWNEHISVLDPQKSTLTEQLTHQLSFQNDMVPTGNITL